MPNEKDLVEAQVSWDLGKDLGLQVSDEKAMVAALSEIPEVQDFVLLRRRGRPKKKKKDILRINKFFSLLQVVVVAGVLVFRLIFASWDFCFVWLLFF